MAEKEHSRSDVKQMQEMIHHTRERMESSQDYMEDNDVSPTQKKQMQEKNQHRAESIDNWQEQIRQETERH